MDDCNSTCNATPSLVYLQRSSYEGTYQTLDDNLQTTIHNQASVDSHNYEGIRPAPHVVINQVLLCLHRMSHTSCTCVTVYVYVCIMYMVCTIICTVRTYVLCVFMYCVYYTYICSVYNVCTACSVCTGPLVSVKAILLCILILL